MTISTGRLIVHLPILIEPYNHVKMKVDKTAIIRIDYDADNLPPAAKEHKPILFREGNLICCLLGADPRSGIFGCGSTLSEAIKDWDADFKRHKAHNVNTIPGPKR